MHFIQKKLKNNLRYIIVPMKDTETVTVLVLVETGSKYETKEKNGISHFLEHMCFKGTDKRPSTYLISKELDEIGAHYNAFTGSEYTGYYAKAAVNHFERIFDVVSDIYLNPTFPKAEIEKEKGVIKEEINMYEDDPKRKIFETFSDLMHGDQPAGWPIAGTKKNVDSMTQKDFISYHRKHYIPNKTVVIVAGKVETKEVSKCIQKAFGKLDIKKYIKKVKTKDIQKKLQVKVVQKKTDQVHFVMGFKSFDTYHKDVYAIEVLSAILSGGFSSRLLMKLREELGVAYYVTSFSDTYTDHGYFGIRAGITKERVTEVFKEIFGILKDIKEKGVLKNELQKAQQFLIGGLKLELESSDAFANFYGGQAVLRKDIKTIKDIERSIKNVSLEDIQRLAKVIFIENKLSIALIGNEINRQDIKKGVNL